MDPTIKYWLDIIGALFSFASTLLYIKVDNRAWPVGLVAICINIVLYYQTGIYGDMMLEMIYFMLTFYGWYQWSWRGLTQSHLNVHHATPRLGLMISLITVLGTWILVQFLTHFTNSQIPYWDALTTVLSLIAQWMICKKLLESWLVWLLVDIMYVGLYLNKALPFHSTLLVMYCGLALLGYWRWRVSLFNHNNPEILQQKT